jgi:hypothetical protein
MSKLTYNINDQIQPLALKIANLEVENSRLVAINRAQAARIDELEKADKTDKPKESAK